MNYIFGNNTLYPRSTRVGGASGGQGAGLGLKQKLGPKRGSSEELAPPHTSSPSTSSPASSSPSTSSSRWQQLLMFFSRRSAFTDCINAGQVNRTRHCVCVCVLLERRGSEWEACNFVRVCAKLLLKQLFVCSEDFWYCCHGNEPWHSAWKPERWCVAMVKPWLSWW